MRPVSALALLCAAALAACQGAPQRAACPAGKTCLEYGANSEPQTLDPQKSSQVDDNAIIADLMMGLTTDAPDGSAVPGAADRWTVSADGLTWTFHLRDARWSDGAPVTADDFVFGLRRTVDPKTASVNASLVYVVRNGEAVAKGKAPPSALGVEAPDPHTVVIRLAHPAPYLVELAKHPAFFPAPRRVVARYGDGWTQPGRYVSNGAFRLTAWRLGDRVTVEKNPWFWDAAHVCPDRVDYYPTPDVVSAERRVARGELDLNTRFQSNRYPRLQKTMPGVAHTGVSLATAYLAFNTRDNAAFRDVRVRRALSEAIDRAFLTDKLMRAGQQPAYAFVPPITAHAASPGARLAWADAPFAARQAQARALLAAAGYGPRRPLRFALLTSNTSDVLLLAEAIQADWRAVGVEARIEQNESGVAYAAYRNRAFQAGLMSWYGDFNDPVTFLDVLKSDTGAQNYGDFRDPGYDALLAQAERTADAGRRAQILARAEQRMLDEEGIAPLYFIVNRNLVSRRLTGWTDNAPNQHRARWMCLRPSSSVIPVSAKAEDRDP